MIRHFTSRKKENQEQKTMVDPYLKEIVETIENINNQKKSLDELLNDTYAEAAAQGYDKKILKKVVKARQDKKTDVMIWELHLAEEYVQALKDISS